jgi:hypothetical protein
MLPNKSINTDAQARPPLRGSLPLVAGYLQRYVAWGGSGLECDETPCSELAASASVLASAWVAPRSPVGLSWPGRGACLRRGWHAKRNSAGVVAHARPRANIMSVSCGRGKHGWLALAGASHNKAVETDAQVRPLLRSHLFLVAAHFYVSCQPCTKQILPPNSQISCATPA